MAICITFGTHEFTSMLEGYENVRAYCYNCEFMAPAVANFDRCSNASESPTNHTATTGQHWNGHCLTRWPFFTVCFVPLIPLSTHKYKEVTCYTCRFTQDLRDRPDITPDTRPPPHMQWGPQPPPGAQWQQQQPQLQSPPVAHGAQQPLESYK
ncbi:hypothetical protein F1880_005007 [Penicillium rolfsii]|nr:hypothetical protein F1880_005007 [Penicillium rolfsii]